jgi:hypothetical protein
LVEFIEHAPPGRLIDAQLISDQAARVAVLVAHEALKSSPSGSR